MPSYHYGYTKTLKGDYNSDLPSKHLKNIKLVGVDEYGRVFEAESTKRIYEEKLHEEGVYGILVTTGEVWSTKSGLMWGVECMECGKLHKARSSDLARGLVRSCGSPGCVTRAHRLKLSEGP